MTQKDLQELICLRMSIDAMRRQFAENLDAMSARVESLIPEDKKQRRVITGDEKAYWEKEVQSYKVSVNG